MSILIVGAGPGIGASVARRFGAEGHDVSLISRHPDRLAQDLGARAAPADATRPEELRAAIAELGDVEVLCFSPLPDVSLIKPVTDTRAEDVAAALALNVTAAATAVGAVLPGMRSRGRGTLLFTTGGAAISPSAERAVSGIVYGAETVYTRMLHEALAPEDIHVAQVTIVGAVGPGKTHEPDAVAEALWQCHAGRGEHLTVLR